MVTTTINQSSKLKNRNRLQLALLFLIPFAAMSLAWIMYFTGLWLPDGRTNKGELLSPPANFADLHLKQGEQTFEAAMTEGLWRVVVFGSTHCQETQCVDSLYKTRQVHIALGKDADRVTRFYVAPQKPTPSSELATEHPGIHWLTADEEQVKTALGLKQWPGNQVFIIDPLGNLIMGYQAEQPGGDLLDDLKKLLKASNIG